MLRVYEGLVSIKQGQGGLQTGRGHELGPVRRFRLSKREGQSRQNSRFGWEPMLLISRLPSQGGSPTRTGAQTGPFMAAGECRLTLAGGHNHPDQLREAASLHLGHGVCPVDLDRARTDAEVEADDLVGVSFDEAVHDIALARRERA